jgi:iron complex transport system substrate-binding protein
MRRVRRRVADAELASILRGPPQAGRPPQDEALSDEAKRPRPERPARLRAGLEGRTPARRRRVAFAAALAAALIASTARAETAKPQRIVSLNVCVDQLLLLMVDHRRIAALTQFAVDRDWSNMPKEAQGFRITHGRAEEVLPLMPDLVIGGEYSAPETIALLRRVGQRVEVMRLANSIDGVRAGMRWVGAAVGEPAKAEAMVAELDRRLAAVAAAIPPGPRPVLAFYNTSGYTAEPGTLADDVIRAAGFENLAGRLGLRIGGRLSLEQVAMARIDALIAIDTAETSASRAVETVQHPALAHMAAAKPFAAIPGRLWTCETPFVAEAAERLARLRAEVERRR